MKRREVKGPPSTDLLVCFPTRSHLTLMPKTISSPSRSSSTTHKNHHCGKSIGNGGHDCSLWPKRNQVGSELSEPTSPKVTCVGQIKARPKSRSCKNWQSVMEEIERLHNSKKDKKKPTWGDVIGFKKESMQFLTSLRSLKFDLGCFGAFPNADIISNEDEDEDGEDEVGSSKSTFSKWFMVLEENQDCGLHGKEKIKTPNKDDYNNDDVTQAPCVPPSNALLLMRCRSAPTKSLLEKKQDVGDDDDDNDEEHDKDDHDCDHNNENDDDEKKRENLMELMKYEGDYFYKLSCDIAKETWIVGGSKKEPISRTQSSKRCSTECLQEVKACLQ
uniref:uncharacterized protein LOC122610532 n=1 Tax=Erigeron canadensis TaxID=72917 RepID=UPI001CB9A5A3|nr:uncharacterized protein LOC122610532 [Erigeron canadensis]